MSRALAAIGAAVALVLAVPAEAKKPLGPGDRIDLNRASVAELMRLPGVGQKKAQAIVNHRAKAPFQRPEDIVQVKGCGPSWFAKVKPNLTVGGAKGPAEAAPAAPPPKK